MTPTDRAMAEIRKRRSVRTPILAAILEMEDAEVDALLAEPLGRGALIGCDVQVGGARVKEYRCSVTSGGQMIDFVPGRPPKRAPDPVKARLREWRPNPSTAEASAGVALPAPSRPAAPRVVDSPKEEPMQGTVIERAIAALKKHPELALSALAQHVGTSAASMSTYMGTLMKKHGVRRVLGKRGVYALSDQKPATLQTGKYDIVVEHPAQSRSSSSSWRAGALAVLRIKREAIARDLTNLDTAIAAIEALG